jgi:hypothetical protein
MYEYAAAGAEEQQSIGARLAEEDHAANSIQCAAVRRKMRLKAGDGGEGSGAGAEVEAEGVSSLVEDASAAAQERAEVEARLAEEDRAALHITRAASMRAKKIRQSTQEIAASAGGAAALDATALIGYAAEAAAEQEAVAARLQEEDRAANTLQCAAVRRNMRLGGGYGGSGKRVRGQGDDGEGEGDDAAKVSYLALLGDAGERASEDAAVAARLAEEEGAVGVIERAACARKLRSARFVPPAARAAQEEARDRQRRQAARQQAAAMGRAPLQRSPAPPGGGGGFGGGGGGGGGYRGPSTHAAGSPLRARGLVSGAATAAPRGGGAPAQAKAHATEVAELRAQVATRDAQVAALQAENAKLKAQVHKLFG